MWICTPNNVDATCPLPLQQKQYLTTFQGGALNLRTPGYLYDHVFPTSASLSLVSRLALLTIESYR